MSNILEYRGYIASVEFSADDMCLVGKIEHINDLILFDGKDASEIEAAFHDAVDSYLAFCQERGKEPNQPFKGTFNIRPGVALHRKAAIEAKRLRISLNDLVSKAIESYLEDEKTIKHEHTHSVTQTIAFEDDATTWGQVHSRILAASPAKEDCH
jgi:predicted HicB family RNase H-like nuclease